MENCDTCKIIKLVSSKYYNSCQQEFILNSAQAQFAVAREYKEKESSRTTNLGYIRNECILLRKRDPVSLHVFRFTSFLW